jgi:molybdenum cofactor biosynthesis protein B
MSETSARHKLEAPKTLTFEIITVSTSRYKQLEEGKSALDKSGDLIESLLKKAGHLVAFRRTISDSKRMIEETMQSSLDSPDIDAFVFCGGTGIAPSDTTIEAVSPFLEKTLPGFGEIFRRLSFDEIGSAAILTRAIAGVARGKAFFCIPGSPQAAKLCVEKLILAEAGHVVKHARE